MNSIYIERDTPHKEVDMKFMLTLPHHIENKALSIRERLDFKTMSLDKLYRKMKTYEMEQEQRKIIYVAKDNSSYSKWTQRERYNSWETRD